MSTTLTNPAAVAPASKSLVKTILWAGLLVGTLDILCAFANAAINGVRPVRVLLYVASGVFGKAAFSGGAFTAICGLLFHFMIAYGCTIFFFWLYPRMKWMSKNNWVTGIVYALFVWIVTNLIIVPLSNTPPGAFHIERALLAWAILIIAIGWPLAWIAQRFFYSKAK